MDSRGRQVPASHKAARQKRNKNPASMLCVP